MRDAEQSGHMAIGKQAEKSTAGLVVLVDLAHAVEDLR
jgi:hypothetical protein